MADVERARELARGALLSLERNRRRIDDLNVYPVPDGDTGTNLTLTVRAAVEQLHATTSHDLATLASELTRAALMGARGNSGVIFSQILRGFAEVVAQAEQLDAPTLARAFRGASDAAYAAVTKPVEGTMLTVIREMAEEAEAHVDGNSRDLLAAVVRRGADAVERTPELLDVLRNAGVVDAGGAGLLEIVRGIAAALAGEPIPEAPPREELSVEAMHQELSQFRYCTVFVVEGGGLEREALQAELEPLGDSLLVVGDATAVKVHVHTDDPGAALAIGTAVGALEQVEIANMHKQTEQREERLLQTVPDAPPALCEMVAFVGARDAETNAAAMEEAVASIATGAVTIASKDAQLNGVAIRKGNFLGLAGGEPVAQGKDFDEVAQAVFERLLTESRGFVTLLTGADRPDVRNLVAALERQHPGLELEVHDGGQPHYPLLVSAE